MNASPAADPKEDLYDFIVVGSGAGGGPLAARLARGGKRVLVLEAGSDGSKKQESSPARELTDVPAFHGLASEHPELSWEFFVRHSGNAGEDEQDPKWDKEKDGIFYPRAAALGGCTIHNAMITIAGPDSDWDDLADFLQDPSWSGASMRRHFEKLEHNEYIRPEARPRWWLTRKWHDLKWLFGREPDYAGGRHGFDGWLHTSLTAISLGLGDRQLKKMLAAALWEVKARTLKGGWRLVRTFLKGNIRRALDPNHAATQRESPEGVVLIPLSIYGKNEGEAKRGRRSGPREWLIQTQKEKPGFLTIRTGCLVTEVLFDHGKTPRAIGVKYREGRNLYAAHPNPSGQPGEARVAHVRSSGEVILCGGAFNSPQLLMLSGIGDPAELSRLGIPCRVESSGVGKNLQDRYEATVVSEMKRDFPLLEGAIFQSPLDPDAADRHLRQWRESGQGLYTSNGAVLGIFVRSREELPQPDLFIFGIPLPFYGYERGYSDVGSKHDFFTWAILKGHTQNFGGVVRLRDKDPLHTPEINFHFFRDAPVETLPLDPDLAAMVEGVKFVRRITKRAGRVVKGEHLHPHDKAGPGETDEEIAKWIRRNAWGHHACGTCRMGADGDRLAVLDSQFRVRGTEGLRVVDASIFPKIPGYFIATNIYMASEKAADLLAPEGSAQTAPMYPPELQKKEHEAIQLRREKAGITPLQSGKVESHLNLTGLGLSGGGIRSATFNLGVLQAMARHQFLPGVDLLSTVSGGGYIGGFLGRCFDRLRVRPGSAPEESGGPTPHQRIAEDLTSSDSRALKWLRYHGNYIAPAGTDDLQTHAATFVRNFLSVHFVLGLALFSLFGIVAAFRYGALETGLVTAGLAGWDPAALPLGSLLRDLLGFFWSPWFVLSELLFLALALPQMVGYWLSSQDEHGRFHPPALGLTLFGIAGALYVGLAMAEKPFVLVAISLALSFIHVEMAWRRGRATEAAQGTGGKDIQRLRTRNILTYDLGISLALCAVTAALAVFDGLAFALHQALIDENQGYLRAFAVLGAALATLAPVARLAARYLASDENADPRRKRRRFTEGPVFAALLTFVLLAAPLIFFAFATHAAYAGGSHFWTGVSATAAAIALSLVFVLRATVPFVNRSSLAQTYTARLARAYLGASNPLRHRPSGADITEVTAGDDASSLREYRPHEAGGPLHLVNVVVNQTVDFTSQRGNRDRLGENVAVSCLGISVGRCWHSLWQEAKDDAGKPLPRRVGLEPVGADRRYGHPLVDTGGPAEGAEALSLRRWIAISGAAIGPGRGQATALRTSLLFGLANLRTGYWWDTGVDATSRDGFPRMSFLRRLLHVLQRFFLTQHLLLSEWIARYPGPWERYWHLSDGGFFENLGGYELIRRRVPMILLSDASADPEYRFDSLANFIRKARIDFGAHIEPFTADDMENVPAHAQLSVGTLADLEPMRDAYGYVTGPSQKHAALFRVRYEGGASRDDSILLYIKASLTGDEEPDVAQYHARHAEFPHESTNDQFFDEAQWESYRKLGEHIAGPIFAGPDWLNKII